MFLGSRQNQMQMLLIGALVLVGVIVLWRGPYGKADLSRSLDMPGPELLYAQEQHEQFMAQAVELSRVAAIEGGGPFGAVVVSKEGKVLGQGYNHVALHTDPTAHGEVMAIRDAAKKQGNFDLKGATLYTSTYPCPMCYAAAHWANIKTIYYANEPEDVAPDFDDQKLWNALTQGKVKWVYPVPEQRQHAQEAFAFWREKVMGGEAVQYNPSNPTDS